MSQAVHLGRGTNQALGIGNYVTDALQGSLRPSQAVLQKTTLFHTDAVLCGLSALALGTNAPTVLRQEALTYRAENPENAAMVFGSNQGVVAEKAVVANCAAVREWDSNGTNFGFRPEKGHTAGEFGHNDFYAVAVAACQQRGLPGSQALLGMVLIDEIRGRLAEVFSLKTYKIDHVVHGAIASAAVYGGLMGATPAQIESAIGMVVAHAIPWRAIRAGKQLSDSKGASAAISTEFAVLCMKRAMAGFRGPGDIFRNPEAIFRFFEPTTEGKDRWKEQGDSPIDLDLSLTGDDFAVMGMHFKLGLYEHQSAGALQAVIDMVASNPDLVDSPDCSAIDSITILAYEPAFGIIGNPMKKDPKTRQSADHSMAYIVATLFRKAAEYRANHGSLPQGGGANDALWKALMLDPYDYQVAPTAIHHPVTRSLMQRIEFQHGGPDYDARYPDGIPTSVTVKTKSGGHLDSGLVMYPAGHARNTTADLQDILSHKFTLLGSLAFPDGADVQAMVDRFNNVAELDAYALACLYDFEIADRHGYESAD